MAGLKVLHTADIHLGRPFSFLPGPAARAHRDRLRRTFSRLIDRANDEGFDLLVIAGDLFDSGRPDQDTVGFAAAQLRRLQAPAVLLPGNHDRPDPRSGYPYAELAARCPTARVFLRPEPEAFPFPDLDLVVYGRAGAPDPQTSPLAGFEQRPGFSFHVVVAHGSYAIPGRTDPTRFPIREEDLVASFADYVALGDWHSCRMVREARPAAWYSGAPEPLKCGEVGAGFFLEVVLDGSPGRVQVRPREIGEAKARADELDLSGLSGVDEIHAALAARRDPTLLLEVRLKGLRRPGLVIDPEELESQYGPEFLALRIIDESGPAPADIPAVPETTVLGAFIRLMNRRLAEAGTEEERRIRQEALQLGVALLSGLEVRL